MKNGKRRPIDRRVAKSEPPPPAAPDPRDGEIAALRDACVKATETLRNRANTIEVLCATTSKLTLQIAELETRPPWIIVVVLVASAMVIGGIATWAVMP